VGDILVGSSSYGGKEKCCPLVVDPLALAVLLGFIAAATFFLNNLIIVNISKKRKKRQAVGNEGSSMGHGSWWVQQAILGKNILLMFCLPANYQTNLALRLLFSSICFAWRLDFKTNKSPGQLLQHSVPSFREARQQ
jgi:hypothetical protein